MTDKWTLVKNKKMNKNKFYNYEPEYNYNIYSDPKTHKKILCKNILSNKQCTYYNKCLYAHSIEDQNVDDIRKLAYDIIKNPNLYDIKEILENNELKETFLELTKLCNDCSKNICPGGYNCKYGAINKKYVVCYNDIFYHSNGGCRNNLCKYVHIFKNQMSKKEEIYDKEVIENKQQNGSKILTDSIYEEDSITQEDVLNDKEIKEYLEKIEEDLCETSIFS
jgi:hypothetical protein